MSDDLEKIILEIRDDMREVKKFISKTDVVTNSEYCRIRTECGKPLKIHGLRKWFEKGCPREDSRHVSIKAVDNWSEKSNTRNYNP